MSDQKTEREVEEARANLLESIRAGRLLEYLDTDITDKGQWHSLTYEGVPVFLGPSRIKGSGRAFASKFIPPSESSTPEELSPKIVPFRNARRIVHKDDPTMFLIRSHGVCVDEGKTRAKAAWALWVGMTPSGDEATGAYLCETKGPFDDDTRVIQTSNRAELRAALVALRFRDWKGEGFRTIVIATNSEYVVEGATTWVKDWAKRDWKNSSKVAIKNRDLWELLLGECERYEDEGMAIQFWRIPKEWNKVCEAGAKEALSTDKTPMDVWMESTGRVRRPGTVARLSNYNK